jgi:hypothetical protein
VPKDNLPARIFPQEAQLQVSSEAPPVKKAIMKLGAVEVLKLQQQQD